MKRIDSKKTSLVDFLRSIKFSQKTATTVEERCATHFAHFNPLVGDAPKNNAEDSQLIRSAN